jgi:hypothetical protein
MKYLLPLVFLFACTPNLENEHYWDREGPIVTVTATPDPTPIEDYPDSNVVCCPRGKVAICHEGNDICVDEHGAYAHTTEHGDVLGGCE